MHRAEGADLSLDSPGLAQLVSRDVACGKDVVLLVSSSCGEAVLDHASVTLDGGRDRVVRIFGQGEESAVDDDGGESRLGLPALLRQLARYAEPSGSGAGHAPERDIAVLTNRGPSCDRVVLLVDNADALQSSALRAIELACQTTGLCLVFAGSPAMLTMLEDVPVLRGRLLRGVRYTAIAETAHALEAGSAPLEPSAPRSRRSSARVIAAAGAAVLGLLGIITVRAFVPSGAETAAPEQRSPDPPRGLAPAADASPDPKSGGEAELAPSSPALVPAAAPVADQAVNQKVHPAKRQPDHRERAVRAATHAAPAPRNVAEKEASAGDFIGSFSPGADGVRAFKYRP